MHHPSREQAPFHSPPLQARALHFFRKFALRARGSGRHPKDAISPVAISTHDFQRTHSSVDILRKPDISPLGFRAEDGPNPMDADDASQDASTSGNSPRIRSRCHSTWDSFRTLPIHPTFAGRGPASLFFRDHAGPGNHPDSANVLAPAPLFLRSTLSLDAALQPRPRSPVFCPDIAPQISAALEVRPHEDAVQNTLDDNTPRPSEVLLPHNPTLATPSVDPEAPSSSHPGDPSRAPSAPTFETISERPALVPHHSAPLPPPFRLATERGLRLSPSIIARQPMPILSLPTLPPPPPPPLAEDGPRRRTVTLRSVPSLSRHGRSSAECQGDHENATLGDSDEDEGDEEEEPADALSMHQSDEEDEEPPSADLSRVHSFRSAQEQPMRDEAHLVDGPASTSSLQAGSKLRDQSRSKTYINPIQMATSPASLAAHPSPPDAENASQPHVVDLDAPINGQLDHTPSLYRVGSRSMINLGSTRRAEDALGHLRSGKVAVPNLVSVSGPIPETRAESEESDTEAGIARRLRRASMPSFRPTSDPPPYPTFGPRPKESRDMPSEDEGREPLPPYSNSLYLIAVMPRKVEFTSPGVQSKDRKWRRVVCELEGTAFRVYKCPPGASGAGVLGDWWEKHVGVGDVASPHPPRTRKKEAQVERSAKLGIDAASMVQMTPASPGWSSSVSSSRPRTESQSTHSTTMTSTPRPTKRLSGTSLLSPFRNSSATRPEMNGGETLRRAEPEAEMQEGVSLVLHEPAGQRPSQPRSASRLTFLPVGTGRGTTWRQNEIAKPPESDLIRAYTLQHAESGLGSDYLKRKNVIRVRFEGEQFLLQAPDTPTVVEWIEALHAGANIALDIDQRPMPRGPMFPRRRRRRARRAQGDEQAT